MNVGQLKILLDGVADDVQVLIPLDTNCFDGFFYKPCIEESGEADTPIDGFEDYDFMSEKSFLLVPRGFFDDVPEDTSHELN